MKPIEQLGISPWPWLNRSDRIFPSVDDVQSFEVAALSDNDLKYANAYLIAAAPKLYDALYRIVEAADDSVADFKKWRENLHVALRDARIALVEASGEKEDVK